jgi:hypothetical protein
VPHQESRCDTVDAYVRYFCSIFPPILAAASFAAISEVFVDTTFPAASTTSHVLAAATSAFACWFATTLFPQHMSEHLVEFGPETCRDPGIYRVVNFSE